MNFFVHLLLAVACLASSSLYGQRTEDEARDDLDYYAQDRPARDYGAGGIWYGGGAQLSFSSSNNQSLFAIGLSPILGYKLTPALSVGPRGSLLFNSYTENFGTRQSSSYFTYSVGAFSRIKAFQQFFAHVEYNLENDVVGFNNADLSPIRRTRGMPYAGAGYVQGGGMQGGVGFEVMILFRLSEREFINESPYIIRSGINVNF